MSNEGNFHLQEKIQLCENVYQYYFVEADKSTVDNIFVFVDGDRKKALILDTIFPPNANVVKKDLEENGIQPEVIVISHYHPDHSGGLSIFEGCRIYASSFYETNYENCCWWRRDLKFIKPTNLLKNMDSFNFGPSRFSFFESPGHSQCSLLTLVNNEFLHIGDLLMFDADGRINLPYISVGGSFSKHIRSLEYLKTIKYKFMLIPHGPVFKDDDQAKVAEHIDNYIYYLDRVLNFKGTLPLEACLKNPISSYSHTEYHDNNLLQFMMES